jgi:low affinity Fe/Cu permease
MVDKGDYDTPGSVEWDYVILDVEREHNDSVGIEQVKVEDLDQSTLDFINESINDDIDSNWENYLYN